jgi:hypothetical protein
MAVSFSLEPCPKEMPDFEQHSKILKLMLHDYFNVKHCLCVVSTSNFNLVFYQGSASIGLFVISLKV